MYLTTENWCFVVLVVVAVVINKSECKQDYYCDQPVDIALLLDSSSDFGRQNFDELKTFAKNFITNVKLSENGLFPHVAFVPYSYYVAVERVVNFRYSSSIRRLSRTIDNIKFVGGWESRLDLALNYTAKTLFQRNKGSRTWVPRAVLAVTGSLDYWDRIDRKLKNKVKIMADALRTKGIQLLVASIGRIGVRNQAYLESLVVRRDDVFVVDQVKDLTQHAKKMVGKFCPVPSTFSCPVKVDIAFIVDSSGSISKQNYNQMKYFMFSIAKALNVSEEGTHVGVVIYSKIARVAIKFTDYKDVASFRRAVYKLEHMKLITRIDLGLNAAYSQLFTSSYGGARSDVKKVAFIMTDGQQSSISGIKPSVGQAARPLIRSGIKMFSIGIGSGVDEKELRSMVENDGDVITATNFDELTGRIKNISRLVCETIETNVCEEVDLAFILDSSGSIDLNEFNEAKEFVETLANKFTISPQKTHIALMIYSDEARIMSRFGKIKSQQDLLSKLDSLPHLRGKTRIDLALKLAGAELFTSNGGMRSLSSVKKVAIVITDGRQSPAADAIRLDEAAVPLLMRGVKVLAIGIGNKIDKFELNMMVLKPEKQVFLAETYDALGSQLAKIEREACSG